MCVFFFKQKTAYEMRISDWSSDVCSSDLTEPSYDLPDFPYPNEELVFKTKCFGEEIPVDPWILAANTPDMQHIRYVHGAEFDGDYRHDLVEWTDHSMKYTYEGAQVTGERKRQTNGIFGSNMFYQETEHSGNWFGFIAPFGLVRPIDRKSVV